MYILGISAWYHDSAACLIKNGIIVAAAQEERFTRIKHDESFPRNAIAYCIKEAGISPADLDTVVFYEKPFVKFERLLETYLAFAPKGFSSFSKSMPLWVKDKLFQKSKLNSELKNIFGKQENWNNKLLFSEHHLSHAASAFYPSPFKNAAILVLDAVGEWSTTSLAIGNKNNLEILKEIRFPHSLGLLYSAFTYYTGFKVNSGEYKMMGLAPYGDPKYVKIIKENLIDIKDDGSFYLNQEYFDYCTGLRMTNNKFDNLFNRKPRKPESEITKDDMDLAASIQKIIEEVLLKTCRTIFKETGEKNLCLAGGVALNCVANGILSKEEIFSKIWIQPAAGDAGGAIGAALSAYHLHFGKDRKINKEYDSMGGSYLGPSYSSQEVTSSLKNKGAIFHKLQMSEIIEETAKALNKGKIVGWVQGRMEFGPRALGNRSILADPSSEEMQKKLNMKIKFRENFRPFAPSVLSEKSNEWFDLKTKSPYMLLVAELKKNRQRKMTLTENKLFGIEKLNIARSSVPAITHVDYSARVQTVDKVVNPLFHSLISEFYKKSKVPMLVNTSFNIRGEPIVCTPEDAYRCFMGTELDLLVINDIILFKSEQDNNVKRGYTEKYQLD